MKIRVQTWRGQVEFDSISEYVEAEISKQDLYSSNEVDNINCRTGYVEAMLIRLIETLHSKNVLSNNDVINITDGAPFEVVE